MGYRLVHLVMLFILLLYGFMIENKFPVLSLQQVLSLVVVLVSFGLHKGLL